MELVYSKRIELDEALDCKNKELNLEYYLVACETDKSCTYGMQITVTNNTGESETAIIHDVLSSKTSMIELIKLFYLNSVTPVTAHDVIYDCIS